MWDIFKAEVLRFRSWAIAYATLQLVVLGFMTRMVDLAQQPKLVYQVIGAVYVLTGLLLGLYQMGGYRRPNAWLNLLHRPIPHWQIALALLAAGALLLFIAVLVPLLVVTGWQETMTARVLDTRHLWLSLSGWLVALCGYLVGGYAMLANKRYGFCAFVFLLLIVFSQAIGMGAIALQLLALAWLLAMVLFAFKPDLAALPRDMQGVMSSSVPGIVATAAPLQLAMWVALMLIGVGVETLWIVTGTHPNNLATEPPNSAKAADFAEGRDLMAMGLKGISSEDAALWREQAAISEVFTMGTNAADLPVRHELTNLAPMEFDDETRRIRWVFSHDSMRYEGYSLANFRAAGVLGVEGDESFPAPPLPGPAGSLLTGSTIYQYDNDAHLVLPRVQLPAGEILTGAELIGEHVAVLSNRALYFYDGRELQNGDGLLTPRQRMPLPGKTGNLTRIDLMELVDGYLVSFLFTRNKHNAEGDIPFQLVQRIDEHGRVEAIARREPDASYGPAWRYQNWYVSPLLYLFKNEALDVFSGYKPVDDDKTRASVPQRILAIAGALMLLSMIGAIWRTRRVDISKPARIAWIIACGLLSVPALISLWLLYPQRDQLDHVPTRSRSLAQTVTA